MILAGFTVPEGQRFEIPSEGHLAWFGQTQLSGKTTALEAFVFRGHLKAIAFITKRGEGSFLTGNMIAPYFSEPTNDPEQPMWRWVKSILEASQQRRMNFEESWIIRACEDLNGPAKTLADVHENIKTLLAGQSVRVPRGRGKKQRMETKWIRRPVTGMNASVYTSLKAYFDIVMPQLKRLPYTKRLTLNTGLNVMDLREYAMETQALVIRSVMEWVYQHERGVRVIVPEAQDFVPQGKNTPVKMACETLVRKGGADKNFMWLDSQDMAAVDKIMLRACSIVGCGVQTEMHEIDRTLSSMFTPALRPLDVAKLKTGQFFVRLPEARVAKVYVMPAWMDSEPHAQAIARGDVPLDSAKAMRAEFAKCVVRLDASDITDDPKQLEIDAAIKADRAKGEDEGMWKEKYEALEKEHAKLVSAHDAMAKEIARLRKIVEARSSVETQGSTAGEGEAPQPLRAGSPSHFETANGDVLDRWYQEIKKRALADQPGILELLVRRPELRIKVERHTLKLDSKNLNGMLARLVHEGFFQATKSRDQIAAELRRRGALSPTSNLKIISPPLAELVSHGFLYRESETEFRAAAGLETVIEGPHE